MVLQLPAVTLQQWCSRQGRSAGFGIMGFASSAAVATPTCVRFVEVNTLPLLAPVREVAQVNLDHMITRGGLSGPSLLDTVELTNFDCL